MIEFSKDAAATALAYASGYFTDPKRRSYINFAGHEFLRGPDRIRRWEELYKNQKGLCACCLRWRDEGKLDMHHLKGHTKKTRCDCYGRRLANGELCIGVEPCEHEDGTGYWFGFDCAHAGDASYDPNNLPAREVAFRAKYPDLHTTTHRLSEHFWTQAEVERETERLAEQFAEMRP